MGRVRAQFIEVHTETSVALEEPYPSMLSEHGAPSPRWPIDRTAPPPPSAQPGRSHGAPPLRRPSRPPHPDPRRRRQRQCHGADRTDAAGPQQPAAPRRRRRAPSSTTAVGQPATPLPADAPFATTVVPSSRLIRCTVAESRWRQWDPATRGLVSTSTSGRAAMTDARFSNCFWPPESSPTFLWNQCWMPK